MSRAPTEFEQRVYALVESIPVGEVVTYAMLAKALGCGSAQAVGQALKRNPTAPQVPCHRVIRADLTIGGYVGETQGVKLEQKRYRWLCRGNARGETREKAMPAPKRRNRV